MTARKRRGSGGTPEIESATLKEVLDRLTSAKPGELAELLTREIVDEIDETKKRIRSLRREIERGARTRGKQDRFRL